MRLNLFTVGILKWLAVCCLFLVHTSGLIGNSHVHLKMSDDLTSFSAMALTINCPAPVTISCDVEPLPDVAGEAVGFTTCAVSEDVVLTWEDNAAQLTACSNTGNLIRTWTATDACAETQTCVQVITIEDVTSPNIMCPSTMMITCDQDTSPANLGIPVVSDNCGTAENLILSYQNQTQNLQGCNGTGTFTRTWRIEDPCGNNAICTQTIIISDVTPPGMTCPPDIEVLCSASVDPDDIGFPTASDACTPEADLQIDFSDNLLGLSGCNGTGTIVRTWAANDACGNMTVCAQMITVVDNEAPAIVCPTNVSIDCADSTQPTETGTATAEDVCGITNISFEDNFDALTGCSGTGTLTRSWTATDGCSNESTCVQEIVITDNVTPTITCPPAATVDCSLGTDPTVTGEIIVNDNCSIGDQIDVSYIDEPEMLTGCNGTGTFQRTWNISDACGNATSCAQIIHVIDETAPEVTCPTDLVLRCEISRVPESTGTPDAFDNCTPAELLVSTFSDDESNAVGCNGTGMIARLWTITDACNNTTQCTQTLMIIDDVQPEINCAPEMTISCENDQSPLFTGYSTASDNCTADDEIVIQFQDTENLNACNGTGTLLRTWTAADACGNSISCTQIIHVVDETTPDITCPSDVEISCSDATSPDALGYPEGSDNCTESEDLEIHYADNLSGLTGCMATGSIVRNWTVLDDCGNLSSCVQTITISDENAPAISCPNNAIISCEDDFSPASLGSATAEDACTPVQMIAISFEDNQDVLPGCNETGILVRTWSATDACGNEATCAQTVQVRDEIAPDIQCPASLTYDCGDNLFPDIIGYALVSDNCSSPDYIAVTFVDDDSGLNGCNGTGNKLRTWTAYDLCGNVSSCVQTMTVVDESGPELICPENRTISCESSLDTSVVGNITVADYCTSFASLSIEFSDTEQGLVGCNGSGSIIRTWIVKDDCGNTSSCAQEISVVDQTPPTIACNAPIEISCGTSQDTSAVKPPVVTDNCSDESEIQILYFDNATGLTGCNGSGTLVRNWIAFDGCGNMSSCDQVIEVVDNTPPVIETPAAITVNCELADDLGVLGQATAIDNCSSADDVFVFFQDIDDGLTGCNGTGLKRRMWIATDGCGNIDTTIQEITLIDTLAPLFYCPLSIAVDPQADIYDFDELGEVEVLVDNCATVENVIIEFEDDLVNLSDCENHPIISRTWYVSDHCGNVGTCEQQITVDHYVAPIATFPENIDIPCEDDVLDMSLVGQPILGTGVASLLVDTIYYQDMQLAEKANDFMHMREWFVIDYCQNVTKDTQYIQKIDEEAPVIELRTMTVTFLEQNAFDITTDDIVVSGTDNCSPQVEYSIEPSSITCDHFLSSNTQVITVTATDEFGNATILQTEAVVVDPQIQFDCPNDIIVDLGSGECDAIVNYSVSAEVPCGVDPIVTQVDPSNLTTGDFFPIGVTSQTYEAADALGAIVTCSFTVTVNPNAAGQFLVCNDAINISIDESCQAQITADELLEGDSYGCEDLYSIYFSDPTINFVDGVLFGSPYIGSHLEICIEDTTTGNFCCTDILIEDKLPPVIECTDVTLSCSEDISPIILDNFPVPEGSIVTPIPGDRFVATGIDNCESTYLEYSDEEEVIMCDGDYIKIVTRTWTATDQTGNTAGCVQTLFLERGIFGEITFPADTILECGDPCILPDGTTSPDCTGAPQGDFCEQFFFAMEDKIIGGCGSTYAIKRTWTLVDWCDPDNIVEAVQVINIDDTVGPVIDCPETIDVPLDQAACTSTVTLVPPPAYDECMSDSITFVLKRGLQTIEEVNGTWTIEDLSIGMHQFTWQAWDACNNITLCDFEVNIVDDVPPVAYCDLHTVVAIQNEDQYGVSLSPATVFDDGSFDACSDVSFRVRRMASCIDFDWTDGSHSHQPDGILNNFDRGLVFQEYVPFSCCDVASNDPVMVQLEVKDESGNINYCMVEVTVQDKIAPELTCPPDIEVSCKFWFDDDILNDFTNRTFGTVVDGFFEDESARQTVIIDDPGNPNFTQPHEWGIDGYAIDNCNMDLTVRVRTYDDCSGQTLPGNEPDGAIRLIERRFLALDPSGKSSSCTQRIWVVNFDPFYINRFDPEDPTDDVVWPADIEVDHCGIPDTIYPIILNEDCGTIAINLEEQKFQFDEGTCMKIFRNWTIVDWCQYNSNTGEGLWTYTQIVKITDSASALFMDCPDETVVLCSVDERIEDLPATLQNPNPCSAHVRLEHVIEDICSETVNYDVKVYLFNGSTPISVVPTRQQSLTNGVTTLVFDTKTSPVFSIAQEGLPYNDPFDRLDAHRILWTVEDACGNISTCSYLLRVEDCKQPTPVCINGLSSVVMPSNGELVIWAIDFDASSVDNCTPDEDLRFSFSGSVYQPSMTYTCDNIVGFGLQIPVEVYVWDNWNNRDYCSTTIVILDNENVCGMPAGGIVGSVSTNDPNTMVGEAQVVLSNPNSYFNQVVTSENGFYSFQSVPSAENYEISIERNDDPKNGVSSLDLIRIQKHLLSTAPITDPYNMIAADINNNGNVSAVDLIELRKLILGVYTEFPDNKSWRFVPENFEFVNPYQPWPFDETVTMDIDSGLMMQEDFIGIKVGDLNASAAANATQIIVRNAFDVLGLEIEEQELLGGQSYEIPVRFDQTIDLSGIQFTLKGSKVQIERITSGVLAVQDVHFAMVNDQLTFSWTDAEAAFIEAGEVAFYLDLIATDDIKASEALELNSSITQAEAYDGEEQIIDIEIQVKDGNKVITEEVFDVALFQNQPNPFTETTIIGFEIPTDSNIELNVFNMTGQLVKRISGVYAQGMHQIEISAGDLQSSGVFYYTLQVGDGHLLTKKMILQSSQ